MFVFLHVPKTAGSTLRHIIEDQHTRRWSRRSFYDNFRPEARWHPEGVAHALLALPRPQREAAQVLYGHFHFGVHRYLPEPVTYYTVLRDPVERAVSHYYYVINHFILGVELDGGPHPDRGRYEAGGLSLEEYMLSGYCPEMDNGQTRMLAGEDGLYDHTPFGQCTRALLDEAKHNLREHVRVVGLTERFDESLLLIRRLCGWRTPYYVKQNVTKGRPKRGQVSAADLAAIHARNALDMELYDYGVELFQQRVAEQGAGFAEQVRRFQERNRRYGPLVTRWNSVVRGLRRGARLAADRLSHHDPHAAERQIGAPLDIGP